MWALFCLILITISILTIIPRTIIGVQKIKKGRLENYFVHRMVSGRIWRDIKDKNTVTVLSYKVQRLLFISYFFSMVGLVFQVLASTGVLQLNPIKTSNQGISTRRDWRFFPILLPKTRPSNNRLL
ncbi:Uncharacterised protein [Listeria newyorkensis]|nr:hypothetical protein EP58_05120 [Listeria newyorkensis]SQC59132.1 Uncharacterised protein [Listeria newyorkensis]